MKGWAVFVTVPHDGYQHVIPVSDDNTEEPEQPHIISADCVCKPQPEAERPDIIVHNEFIPEEQEAAVERVM